MKLCMPIKFNLIWKCQQAPGGQITPQKSNNNTDGAQLFYPSTIWQVRPQNPHWPQATIRASVQQAGGKWHTVISAIADLTVLIIECDICKVFVKNYCRSRKGLWLSLVKQWLCCNRSWN